MKKYILGLSAIALGIFFSAFSFDSAPGKTVKPDSKPQPLLYWYGINADGSLGSALNSGTQMDKATAFGFTACQDVTSTDCVRGYSSTQIVGTDPAPSTSTDVDYHILKNQ
jgi:hypothetical protein